MVDNDVEDIHRQDLIEYIKEKYGEVYNIRTFNYLGVKGSIQRAAQALKMEPQESIQLSKSVESFDDIEGHEELVDIARHFEGLLSSFGCHASAICLFPTDPNNFCSIEKQGETFLASYNYHDLEDMNLIKEDILGLRNLTVIHETLKLINYAVDILSLPLDDTDVLKQYAEGNTTAIFQCDSAIMRKYAKLMRVDCFNDITALLALVRPGPLDSGMAQQYIDGKNGEEVECIHPLLEDVLGGSFQVLCYQEQAMKIARVIGGYSLGESDELRKIIGRKELEKIDAAVSEFIKRSIQNNIPEEVAEELGRILKACGRYIFNLSHATLYSYTSYITAYLKYHYPLEYMCSILNSVVDDQEKTVEYMNECKRLGIKIVSPNVKLKNTTWVIKEKSLAMGLYYPKGVGKNLCLDKVDTFVDLVSTNNKRVVEALIKCGACDVYSKPRALLLSSLVNTQEILSRRQQCLEKIQENNAGLHEAQQAHDDKLIRKYERQINSWTVKLDEVNQKSTIVINHDNYDQTAEEFSVLSMSFSEIPKVKTGKLTKIFTKEDKNKNLMAWMTFECQTYGTIRATVFASQWSKIKTSVAQGETYVFCCSDKGILEEISIDGHTVVLKQKQWNGQKKRA